MKTKPIAIVLIFVFTWVSASAQYFYKIGAVNFSVENVNIIDNYAIIAGFLLYALGAVMVIFTLKQADLSVAYPMFALSYIWVALISIIILKEQIPFLNWIGILSVVTGISFVGYGAEHG